MEQNSAMCFDEVMGSLQPVRRRRFGPQRRWKRESRGQNGLRLPRPIVRGALVGTEAARCPGSRVISVHSPSPTFIEWLEPLPAPEWRLAVHSGGTAPDFHRLPRLLRAGGLCAGMVAASMGRARAP